MGEAFHSLVRNTRESFKLESEGKGVNLRNTEVMPWDDAVLFEDGKASGSICAAPGSVEGSGAHQKCLYTNKPTSIHIHTVWGTNGMKWKLLFFPSALIPSVSVRLGGMSLTADCWEEGLFAVQDGAGVCECIVMYV